MVICAVQVGRFDVGSLPYIFEVAFSRALVRRATSSFLAGSVKISLLNAGPAHAHGL
jgi:hypothetical protein